MKRYLSALFLGAALLAPVFLHAEEPHRYYDKHHKDWHEWNANEDRAYHRYWEQQHKPYREFIVVKPREQSNYWRWRHAHADVVIVP
jgi:hypothetical protein